MKGTPEEVLKSIPDFTELISLSNEISSLSLAKMKLETKIKEMESSVFKRCFTEEKFFQGGKPPSAAFVDNTYKFPGTDGEILPVRYELADTVSALDQKRIQMDIYKTMIDIWRTLSSNQRASVG